MPEAKRPNRDSNGLLLVWLVNAVLAAVAVSALVLGLAAPGPTWAKFVAGGLVLAVMAAVVLVWVGYLYGSRRRSGDE